MIVTLSKRVSSFPRYIRSLAAAPRDRSPQFGDVALLSRVYKTSATTARLETKKSFL